MAKKEIPQPIKDIDIVLKVLCTQGIRQWDVATIGQMIDNIFTPTYIQQIASKIAKDGFAIENKIETGYFGEPLPMTKVTYEIKFEGHLFLSQGGYEGQYIREGNTRDSQAKRERVPSVINKDNISKIDLNKEEGKLVSILADQYGWSEFEGKLYPRPDKREPFLRDVSILFAKCDEAELKRAFWLANNLAIKYGCGDLTPSIEKLKNDILDSHLPLPVNLPIQSAKLVEVKSDKISHTQISFLVKYWSILEKSPILSSAMGNILATIAAAIFVSVVVGFFWELYFWFKSFWLYVAEVFIVLRD